MKSFEAVVEEVVRETADATTLVLTPREPIEYRAGQFVTVDPHQFPQLAPLIADLEHRKGKGELVRAYSLSSSPHHAWLAITIKVEDYDPATMPYPPLLSPLLAHGMHRGDVLQLCGCLGMYSLAPDAPGAADHVLHVVAGSGAVPNLSLLRWDLETQSARRHFFVDTNRTTADILFREELADLERRFPSRLQVRHVLTREADAERHGTGYRSGRIGEALLRSLVADAATVECFCCGPGITVWERKAALAAGTHAAPRFLETVVGLLKELGVDRKRIHQEAYG